MLDKTHKFDNDLKKKLFRNFSQDEIDDFKNSVLDFQKMLSIFRYLNYMSIYVLSSLRFCLKEKCDFEDFYINHHSI